MEKAWEKRLAEARKENEVLLANAYPSSVMHGRRHLLSCVLTCVLIFFCVCNCTLEIEATDNKYGIVTTVHKFLGPDFFTCFGDFQSLTKHMSILLHGFLCVFQTISTTDLPCNLLHAEQLPFAMLY